MIDLYLSKYKIRAINEFSIIIDARQMHLNNFKQDEICLQFSFENIIRLFNTTTAL